MIKLLKYGYCRFFYKTKMVFLYEQNYVIAILVGNKFELNYFILQKVYFEHELW